MKLKYHFISLQGKRQSNEDEHVIFKNLNNKKKEYYPVDCVCLFDGHGGGEVSKYLKSNLCTKLVSKKTGLNYVRTKPMNFKKKIDALFNKTQENIFKKKIKFAGSTSLNCIFYKQGGNLFLRIINLGDCRIILSNKNMKIIQLTIDHRPSIPMEKKRIEKLGGRIIFDGYCHRINGLSVSRGFGDFYAKPHLSNIPDVYNYKINKGDHFAVIACDGLWDFCTNEEVVDFIHQKLQKYKKIGNSQACSIRNISYELATHVLKKGGTDNVSIIIVFFEK